MVAGRLDDDDARKPVRGLLTICTELVAAESFEQATDRYMALERQTVKVKQVLGKVIRESWPE
jgi:hypothetical protein